MLIIGAGRVGQALYRVARERERHCVLVTREAGWEWIEEEPPGQPILVATRNAHLGTVVDRVAERRRSDLVFIQNGMLRPFLAERGLGEATRGLLFAAIATRESAILPGGVSPFTGPHARAMVAEMAFLGLSARELDRQRFSEVELEKLIWNSALGLLCEAYDCTVGEVVDRHSGPLAELVEELIRVGAPAMHLTVAPNEVTRRIREYSLSIATYRGSVKEWEWRNGWFVTTARRARIPTPTHDRLLAETGHAPA